MPSPSSFVDALRLNLLLSKRFSHHHHHRDHPVSATILLCICVKLLSRYDPRKNSENLKALCVGGKHMKQPVYAPRREGEKLELLGAVDQELGTRKENIIIYSRETELDGARSRMPKRPRGLGPKELLC